MRKTATLYLVAVLALCCVLISVKFFLSNGRLTINTIGFTATTKLTIFDENDKAISRKTHANITISIKQGLYRVEVFDDSHNSAIGFINVKGRLATSTLSLKADQQYGQEILGKNPSNCMGMLAGLMYSNDCQGDFSLSKLHLAANEVTPPITMAPRNPPANATVLSQFEELGKTYLVISESGAVFLNELIYNELDRSLSLRRVRDMNINNSVDRVFGQKTTFGYVLADPAHQKAYYYTGLGVEPTKTVDLPTPRYSDYSAGAYAFKENGDIAIFEKQAIVRVEGTTTSGNLRLKDVTREINRDVRKLDFCFGDKLCALEENNRVQVFSNSGGSLKIVGELTGVTNFASFGNSNILVAVSGGLALLNESLSGSYLVYGSGLSIESINLLPDGDVLAKIGGSKGDIGLRLSKTLPDNRLLYKYGALESRAYIKSLSVYKKYLYITPEAGRPEYNAALELYDYPQPTVDNIRQQLNKDRTELDLKNYQIEVPLLGISL